jgi:membrane protein insertase Oxa1/YidC/SpoIIIJ
LNNAYGPSIVLFTVFVRCALLPLNYQQLVASQKTLALTPKIQEIKEKFASNKDTQNKMVALMYQETKVSVC